LLLVWTRLYYAGRV